MNVSKPKPVEGDVLVEQKPEQKETLSVVLDPSQKEAEYAFNYYRPAKNWGMGGVWFVFAFNILIWPTMWVFSWVYNQLPFLEGNVFLLKALYLSFVWIGCIGVVAGVVGLFTYKSRDQKIWPSLVATVVGVLSLVTSTMVWFIPGFALPV